MASAVDFFSVAFIVVSDTSDHHPPAKVLTQARKAPFAMVAGGSISATQIYKPQNVFAWVMMTLGPGLMSIIKWNSPKHAWVPLCVSPPADFS